MKSWRAAAVLLLSLVLVGSMACNPFGGDQEETSQQLIEVVRGDLVLSVSGSGNIVITDEVNLAFGTGGRIDKIFINEGDEVSEGKVLAKLDTAPLELALTQAQAALAQAQTALAQAQIAQTQAQIAQTQAQIAQAPAQVALTQAQAAWTQTQAAQTQAQIALNTAEDNLEDTYDLLRWSKRTFDQNDAALKDAEVMFETAELEFEVAEAQFAAAELQLEAAGLQFEIAGSQLEVVEPQLEAAGLQVEAAGLQVEAANLQIEAAEQALGEAQKQLNRTTITAPFDGAVVSVDADEGDSVSTMTTIVHLIDPTSIELEVEVDEIDIAEVKLGQRAIIEVDALPALQLEGKVTSISLLSKETGGLVLYKVTIGFDVPQGYNLKIGMSAIADIVIDERSNVLLVPNRAITQDSQGNPIVKVMVDEEIGEIEERPVVLGISDGFQIEIVDGLNEEDVVVIETKVKSSAPGLF